MSKVIAIDGPSGSGKSTIAKLVAQKLDLTYLDTGAMFRGLGYSLTQMDINFDDREGVENFLNEVEFEYGVSDTVLIRINGNDLTGVIREHEVSRLASEVSQIPAVRIFLKRIQREIASTRPSILEGRDIGTVIFPDSPLKFFLTADPRVRAKRRYDQLKEKDPLSVANMTVEKILEDIESRDMKDQARALAPLSKADDAYEIDTSELSIEEIIELIISKYKENKQFFK